MAQDAPVQNINNEAYELLAQVQNKCRANPAAVVSATQDPAQALRLSDASRTITFTTWVRHDDGQSVTKPELMKPQRAHQWMAYARPEKDGAEPHPAYTYLATRALVAAASKNQKEPIHLVDMVPLYTGSLDTVRKGNQLRKPTNYVQTAKDLSLFTLGIALKIPAEYNLIPVQGADGSEILRHACLKHLKNSLLSLDLLPRVVGVDTTP